MDFVRAEGGKQVAVGEAFVPEVLFEGNYYPICGHYFWDNDFGAETVCKALGFDGGAKTNTAAKFEEHAMPVGACNQGEELDKCTAGANQWGNFDDRSGWCNAGNTIGVEVTCTGDLLTHSLTHSLNHHTHTHTHVYTLAYKPPALHAHTYMHTYIPTYLHIYIHAITHTYTRNCL